MSRYKNLPLPPLPPPSLMHLELENTKLKEEKKRLEAVVNVLYKQNLQYFEAFNQHKALDEKVRKEMDRTLRVMASTISMQLQNYSNMRAVEKRTVTDWEDFFDDMEAGEVEEVEETLDSIKQRIFESEVEETGKITIGVKL